MAWACNPSATSTCWLQRFGTTIHGWGRTSTSSMFWGFGIISVTLIRLEGSCCHVVTSNYDFFVLSWYDISELPKIIILWVIYLVLLWWFKPFFCRLTKTWGLSRGVGGRLASLICGVQKRNLWSKQFIFRKFCPFDPMWGNCLEQRISNDRAGNLMRWIHHYFSCLFLGSLLLCLLMMSK